MPECISILTRQQFLGRIEAAQDIETLISMMGELRQLFMSAFESDDWIVDALETALKKRARQLQYLRQQK